MLTGLSGYLPENTLTLYDNLEFLIRLLLSAGLGALVGLERSKRQKEAGVRTHCIIACTSALFMILSKYSFIDVTTIDGLRGADPARIAAQVVSGISFLGAGVIFKNAALLIWWGTTIPIPTLTAWTIRFWWKRISWSICMRILYPKQRRRARWIKFSKRRQAKRSAKKCLCCKRYYDKFSARNRRLTHFQQSGSFLQRHQLVR